MKTRRWLIVVQQGHRELYEFLRQNFMAEAPIDLIYERRVGERRRGGNAPRSDRRQADRRQRRPTAWFFQGGLRDAGRSPAETSGRAETAPKPAAEIGSKRCPECGLVVGFEMPRFPQPPSRIEVEVIHLKDSAAGRHQIEVAAFSGSGRPLLVQRIQPSPQR
ncbi:MAG TPA: hypothetical protein VGW35_17420, partial [Methylomirabilota bacterium]|jgi:hypothetical protein|nr:hypothetical protein [Methylomirabilota bacterium]